MAAKFKQAWFATRDTDNGRMIALNSEVTFHRFDTREAAEEWVLAPYAHSCWDKSALAVTTLKLDFPWQTAQPWKKVRKSDWMDNARGIIHPFALVDVRTVEVGDYIHIYPRVPIFVATGAKLLYDFTPLPQCIADIVEEIDEIIQEARIDERDFIPTKYHSLLFAYLHKQITADEVVYHVIQKALQQEE